MILDGTFVNGVITLDSPAHLPEGTRVRVVVTQVKPTLAERLLQHAGSVPGLPVDLAAQHDHYIHGTPKK